jgi:hypothetical protein
MESINSGNSISKNVAENQRIRQLVQAFGNYLVFF